MSIIKSLISLVFSFCGFHFAQFIDDYSDDPGEFEFGISNPGSTYSEYDVDFIDFVDDCDDL
jgi:hypothetical protein